MKTAPEEPDVASLRVWWIPQIPMNPFWVGVPDLPTAKLLLDTLARYDTFQFENRIKPDYCNAGGLSTWDGEEWVDWESADGDSIREICL